MFRFVLYYFFRCVESRLWIRIRINLSSWIRIRIQEEKMKHKYIKKGKNFMF
jgi:hypothetical protein